MARPTNDITIQRDEKGHYVVTDYLGEHIFELLNNVLGYMEDRLKQQDSRIAQYRQDPKAWRVDGISELTM